MPGTKIVGTKTAISTSAMPITAAETSRIVRREASIGERPSAMLRSTFSTTTMASSTTMPIASTSPNRVSRFSEYPSASMAAKVPISDTGIASIGISAERQDCRNTITTKTTSAAASKIVW